MRFTYDIIFHQTKPLEVSENLSSLISILPSFLFYRQKAETDKTGELELSGRQWQVWDSSLRCCHTTLHILIQGSIRMADKIMAHVTKSWLPLG